MKITVYQCVLDAMNGNWGKWTSFSDCTHSCSGGTQFRLRSCDNPGPAYGGIWCPGNDTHIQSCNMDPCPGKFVFIKLCINSIFYMLLWLF